MNKVFIEYCGEKKVYEKPEVEPYDFQFNTLLLVDSIEDSIDVPYAGREEYGIPEELLSQR